MSRKHIVTRIEHLKCDVCGKEEDIDVSDDNIVHGFFTRYWSRVMFDQYHTTRGLVKPTDLCPTCTRKFKKMIRAVTLEEDITNGNE